MNTDDFSVSVDEREIALKLSFLVGKKIMFRETGNRVIVANVDSLVVDTSGKLCPVTVVELWSRYGCQKINSRGMLEWIFIEWNGVFTPLNQVLDDNNCAIW